MRCAMDEHRAIVAAIERGDAAEAEQQARRHVRLSEEAFLRGSALSST
jgi:DNA-binding FadR family transcriptional regulator